METLVTKTLRRISAVNDDFFETELVVDTLNKSQRKIISYAVQKERENPKRSLRALDLVRRNETLTTLTYTNSGNYYESVVDFPSINLNQFLYLNFKVDGTTYYTPLRELTGSRLHTLENGNIRPSRYEGYFHVDRDFTAATTASYLVDYGSFSTNAPANGTAGTFTMTAVVDSVARTFTYSAAISDYTSSAAVQAYLLNLIAAINDDALFYYSAALGDTATKVVLTAKGSGTKFNGNIGNITIGGFGSGATSKSVVTAAVNADTTPVFNLYVHSNVSANELKVYYVDNPTDIAAYDTEFFDLPEQLENAAIYGACMMLLMTEKPTADGAPNASVATFADLYKQELELSSY